MSAAHDHRITEREYKFSPQEGEGPEDEELRQALAGTSFTLSAATLREQRDVYYDDRQHALATAGVALRRRSVDGRMLATFKGPRRGQGALYEREELELPLVGSINARAPRTASDRDPPEGDWPPAVARRVAPYAALHLLRPVLELSTQRRCYALSLDGMHQAELAVDDVRARLPGSQVEARFCELELEAHGPADLAPLAVLLETRLRLTASPAGKLERAHALLSLGRALEQNQ
ncbi:MAG TPA: CYTH domain-containing protein [Trueperaceae bacterium]